MRLTAEGVFTRYEALRPRLPAWPDDQTAAPPSARTPTAVASLLDISEAAEAFVFDAFGVLNVGTQPIDGAAERLQQLRAKGYQIRVLSNAASNGKAQTLAKFDALGLALSAEEIITSRDATLTAVDDRLWGVIAAPDDALDDITAPTRRLGQTSADYAAVEGFVFLSSAAWDMDQQALLARHLRDNPRPVLIANADLVAPRQTGLSLEPGFFGHHLIDQGHEDVRFFGKPYSDVYDLLAASLPDMHPDRIVMCGDTLHTDILGAAAVGWQTALITQDGVYAGEDANHYVQRARITPTYILPRI
ncbi:HAD hydrolase-like protein [Phaeobacter sp.]|uniref:HAD-IIA family hydrolase n=1 Tax=Phaeobacter sp. TaxID=1902409 RepID=UPI0025F00F1A|nr:HAD hydrolase-like protein [Phaeobacter sp.]